MYHCYIHVCDLAVKESLLPSVVEKSYYLSLSTLMLATAIVCLVVHSLPSE